MAAGDLLTTDGQIEWRGLLLGAASPFRWRSLTGWLDMELRASDTSMGNWHGEHPGQALSSARYVTFQFFTKGLILAEFPDAVAALRQATAPDENPAEEPLAIQLHGEKLLVYARCLRRHLPVDVPYSVGHVAAGAIQWKATDPRLYSAVEHSASAGLALPGSSGLDFSGGGLDFSGGGLDFGTGQQGGVLTARNAGHVPTWPTIEVSGPTTGPVINVDGRRLLFDPSYTVLAGQTMVIDTRPTWRTVQIVPAGSPPGTDGVSVRQHLQVEQWAPLEAGVDTQITFTAAAYDAASQLTVRWRDAWH